MGAESLPLTESFQTVRLHRGGWGGVKERTRIQADLMLLAFVGFVLLSWRGFDWKNRTVFWIIQASKNLKFVCLFPIICSSMLGTRFVVVYCADAIRQIFSSRLVVWSPPSLSSKPEAVSRAGPKYSKWTRPLTSRYRLLRSHQTVYVTSHTLNYTTKDCFNLQCSSKIDNDIHTFYGLFKRAFSEWISRIYDSRKKGLQVIDL